MIREQILFQLYSRRNVNNPRLKSRVSAKQADEKANQFEKLEGR